jgi:TetR/AcrR family transcriptional regulator, lmrAB and yxaGH operons repressor
MPTPPPLQKTEIIQRIAMLFRQHGYEGASLALIAAATGLGRSSIYHYFPGGKDEMVEAVFEQTAGWVAENILAPLRAPGEPATRIEQMLRAVDALYDGGKLNCLLGVLALGNSHERFQQHLKQRFDGWINALTRLLMEAGIDKKLAAERAEDAVVRIQGALIVARGRATAAPFKRALHRVKEELLAPVG